MAKSRLSTKMERVRTEMKPDRPQFGMRALTGVLGLMSLAIAPLSAQTHKVAKSENVVRAVGVYEWTGDMAKPAASRLIPVSLFIDGKLQDAGIYLAAPIPMALLSGNDYQLQKSGIVVGDLDLAFARHLVAAGDATTTYDDGWFGYGKFVAPAAEKKSTLKPTATVAKINDFDDMDSDRPHFSSRSATPGSGDAATPLPGTATASTAGAPGDDPDRLRCIAPAAARIRVPAQVLRARAARRRMIQTGQPCGGGRPMRRRIAVTSPASAALRIH